MARISQGDSDREREFPMSDKEFRAIAATLHEHAGIVLGERKRELVYGRLSRRLRALGLASFKQYVDRLHGPDADLEQAHFINALTTNHTQFFREPHHFDFIREVAIPHWTRRARETDDWRLRLWSAGCSTGEEPYSLAMTLAKALEHEPRWDWKVLATDIDTKTLQHGRMAEYAASVGASIPTDLRNAYSKPVGRQSDRFRMNSNIRDRVVFNRLNLLGPWPITVRFDAVFCRNVIIYFDAETKSSLVSRYAKVLKPDGWLMLGHAESILDSRHKLQPIGRTIYASDFGAVE